MASPVVGRGAGADPADRGNGRGCPLDRRSRHDERRGLMGTGIQVEALSAWFGKTQALNAVTMTIEPNRATAIIGPSGCGKSTFVRCLNRMHETHPQARAEGKVRIGETDIY